MIGPQGAGRRRRPTYSARFDAVQSRARFTAACSHPVVEIDACLLLAFELDGALSAVREIAAVLALCVGR
ncbi:MAG: hypothetical protein U1E20_15080 [Methylocystis sp.]|uniref:hypothetical protein n=1 Tax=Methylocystis sp. TaxID=1911079 RepID=UPI00395F2C03